MFSTHCRFSSIRSPSVRWRVRLSVDSAESQKLAMLANSTSRFSWCMRSPLSSPTRNVSTSSLSSRSLLFSSRMCLSTASETSFFKLSHLFCSWAPLRPIWLICSVTCGRDRLTWLTRRLTSVRTVSMWACLHGSHSSWSQWQHRARWPSVWQAAQPPPPTAPSAPSRPKTAMLGALLWDRPAALYLGMAPSEAFSGAALDAAATSALGLPSPGRGGSSRKLMMVRLLGKCEGPPRGTMWSARHSGHRNMRVRRSTRPSRQGLRQKVCWHGNSLGCLKRSRQTGHWSRRWTCSAEYVMFSGSDMMRATMLHTMLLRMGAEVSWNPICMSGRIVNNNLCLYQIFTGW